MEEIIPIFIVILLISEIKDLKGHLDLIIDFIEFDTCDLEAERRLLLNLSVLRELTRNPSTISIAIGKCDVQTKRYQFFIIYLNGRSTDICAGLSQIHLRRRPQSCLRSLWRNQRNTDDQRLRLHRNNHKNQVFDSEDSVGKAVEEMNGKDINDQRVRVEIAGQPKKPKGPQPNDECRLCGRKGHWYFKVYVGKTTALTCGEISTLL